MKMFFTRCEACDTTYHVIGRPEEVENLLDIPEWRVNLPCVTPQCAGRAKRITVREALATKAIEVPIYNYYRALQGFGPPVGDPAAAEVVRRLLLEQRVVSCELLPVGQPERTILRSLTLEDGTKLHFEASDKGACIYFVEGVRNGRAVAAEADPSSSGQDRSEARPDLGEDEGQPDVEAHQLEGTVVPGVHAPDGVRAGGAERRDDGDHSEMRLRAAD